MIVIFGRARLKWILFNQIPVGATVIDGKEEEFWTKLGPMHLANPESNEIRRPALAEKFAVVERLDACVAP